MVVLAMNLELFSSRYTSTRKRETKNENLELTVLHITSRWVDWFGLSLSNRSVGDPEPFRRDQPTAETKHGSNAKLLNLPGHGKSPESTGACLVATCPTTQANVSSNAKLQASGSTAALPINKNELYQCFNIFY